VFSWYYRLNHDIISATMTAEFDWQNWSDPNRHPLPDLSAIGGIEINPYGPIPPEVEDLKQDLLDYCEDFKEKRGNQSFIEEGRGEGAMGVLFFGRTLRTIPYDTCIFASEPLPPSGSERLHKLSTVYAIYPNGVGTLRV